MESFLHAVTSVTIILLLTATGYFCAVRGWMSPQAKRFISRFTMSVAVSSRMMVTEETACRNPSMV